MPTSTDITNETNTDPVVAMTRLQRRYQLGETTIYALREVDLKIHPGDYLAIMGPSGSGKSTLLNILGCLDQPTGGEYRLGGENVAQLDDNQLSAIRGTRLGFVFQSYNLIQQLTVLENIEVPLMYRRVHPQQCRHRAIELATIVGLADRTDHRPNQLSGGQQQRVAIARALANDPLIILADEPTGNLDSSSGTDILNLLDTLHQQGKTLVIVTHDPNVATRAQRILHLLDGGVDHIETTDNHHPPTGNHS